MVTDLKPLDKKIHMAMYNYELNPLIIYARTNVKGKATKVLNGNANKLNIAGSKFWPTDFCFYRLDKRAPAFIPNVGDTNISSVCFASRRLDSLDFCFCSADRFRDQKRMQRFAPGHAFKSQETKGS
jgi:hypothetical protein